MTGMPDTKAPTSTPERLASDTILCLAILWITAVILLTPVLWLLSSFSPDVKLAAWAFVACLAGGLLLLVAKGIGKRRAWARSTGIVLALATLLAFPIGTILGIFLLLQLVIRWHPDEDEPERDGPA